MQWFNLILGAVLILLSFLFAITFNKIEFNKKWKKFVAAALMVTAVFTGAFLIFSVLLVA